jgi:DNA-binding NtrC family response regulator
MERNTIRILQFEDYQDDAILTGYFLAEVKNIVCNICHVERLSLGLEQLSNNNFDLILLDLNLPDSQGLSTFEEVQKIAGDIPIIIMSGMVDEDLAVCAVQKGAQDYLIKGQIDSQLLIRAILYAIERQKLKVKLQEALHQVKTLEGLLPICCYCKNIRDENGFWFSVENYMRSRSNAEFSHGICPECAEKHYSGLSRRTNWEK